MNIHIEIELSDEFLDEIIEEFEWWFECKYDFPTNLSDEQKSKLKILIAESIKGEIQDNFLGDMYQYLPDYYSDYIKKLGIKRK